MEEVVSKWNWLISKFLVNRQDFRQLPFWNRFFSAMITNPLSPKIFFKRPAPLKMKFNDSTHNIECNRGDYHILFVRVIYIMNMHIIWIVGSNDYLTNYMFTNPCYQKSSSFPLKDPQNYYFFYFNCQIILRLMFVLILFQHYFGKKNSKN